jgi:hypothetical protein
MLLISASLWLDPHLSKKVQIFIAPIGRWRSVRLGTERLATIIRAYDYRSLNMLPNEGIAVTDLPDLATAVSAGAYWRVCLLKVVHGFPHGRIAFRPFPHGHLTVGVVLRKYS